MGTRFEVLDSRASSEFCGVDSSAQVPGGDTIGRFRALLVENGLQEKLFLQVVALLEARGLILKKGTIVDSTIISAPPSTNNRVKKRDPEACQTKKGNTWHFGYKAHIGVDKTSGFVHHLETTAANVHDVTMTSKLLHGERERARRFRLPRSGSTQRQYHPQQTRKENAIQNQSQAVSEQT